MKQLTHYIVVRRDLPFGVILSMVAHAAGESFYKLASPHSSVTEHSVANREAGGVIPSAGSNFVPSETIAIVMGARNQSKLARLATALERAAVSYVAVTETDGEFAGQVMAIGIVPGDRAALAPLVNEFQLFKVMESS